MSSEWGRITRLLYFNCLIVCIVCCPQSIRAFDIIPGKDSVLVSTKTAGIRGTVIDKTTNLMIPYAGITIVDNKISVQANSKGEFALSVRPGNENGSIRISALGYIPQEFSIADLIKQKAGTNGIKFFLRPKHEKLNEVEIKTKASKWKTKKVGYHVDKGTPFHYEFTPSDTLTAETTGQEIGNRIYLKKHPASLQSVSFGLTGSGNAKVIVKVRLYSLEDNLPHLNLLPETAIVPIPPHHTGWITVNLEKYNLTLKEDFAVVIEWMTDAHKLSNSSLMTFANLPKDQVIYYRESNQKPWKISKTTLLNVRSIGMYATLLYEK